MREISSHKAESLLTDWAMSKADPQHIPTGRHISFMFSAPCQDKRKYRTDSLLWDGRKTMVEIRDEIERTLRTNLSMQALQAAYLYFAQPKASFAKVSRALECSPGFVSSAVKKAIMLVKYSHT